MKLLNEKPLDKITIKDIVEDCGINRNTFYYHFDDIPDLVEQILREETEKALLRHGDVASWEEGFIAAAQFALSNKRAVYHIYNSVSREQFERYLNRIAQDVMERFVHGLAADIPAGDADRALVVNFYRAALVGMVLDWMNSGMRQEPEGTIRRLGMLLEGSVRQCLERSAASQR